MTARVVLVHGAWHRASSWAPVVAELERAGVPASAPELPSDTPGAGYEDLMAPVLAAAGAEGPVVLAGHSLGGLVAAAAAGRLDPARVRALVLVGALVPEPGRPYRDRMRAEPDLMVPGYDTGVRRGEGRITHWPDAETAATGLYRGVADELAGADELQDAPVDAESRSGSPGATGRGGPAVPAVSPGGPAASPGGPAVPGANSAGPAVPEAGAGRAVVAAAVADLRPQDWTLLAEPCPLTAWPAVRTVSVICTGDRVVDPDGSRREAARIGAEVVELAGGHFPMCTRPAELAGLLAGVAADPG